jgi:ankyrin repeat protein
MVIIFQTLIKTHPAFTVHVCVYQTSDGKSGWDSETPLIRAAKTNNLKMIQALLKVGADINGENEVCLLCFAFLFIFCDIF